MTTIAILGRTVAADTATTFGCGMSRLDSPKIVAHHGCIAGAAGSATYCGAFLRWFEAGEKSDCEPEAKSEGDGPDTGVILRPDGSIDIYQPGGWYRARPPYYALGSGGSFAMGAMYMGASAYNAVRAGIEHDPWTGGEITVLTLPETGE